MRRSLSLILILAGAALVAACASQPRHHLRRGAGMSPGGPGMMPRGGLFVSPAGEPFRRAEGGPPAMQAWFAQADADHDGALVWTEFEADFVRWFAILDADHDGEIAPAEVTRYETEILPEMQSRAGPSGGMRMMRGGGMGRSRDGMGGGGRRGLQQRSGGPQRGAGAMAMLSGAARFGLLPINHPIMDADADFNRGVSRQEFTQAAARRFAMLNTQNNGRLTLPQLTELRMQAFGPRRRSGEARSGGASSPPPPNED